MLLPDGDYVAVQKIHSSDLAMFVNRAEDGMLPSPGDLRNIAKTKVVTRPIYVIACPFNLQRCQGTSR